MPRREVDYPPPLGRPSPPPPAPAEAGPGDVAPQQVLLGAGAVAVVAAGAASLTDAGSVPGLLVVTLLTVAATLGSLRAGRRGLRSSEEALASAAVVLAAVGAWSAGDGPGGPTAVLLALLAAVFAVLGLIGRSTLTWPTAAWGAAQGAVLSGLTGSGLSLAPHASAVLATAVVGLAATLAARRAVAVVTLVTAAAWWVTGVVEGSALVWTTESVAVAVAPAVLMLLAAGALLALRRRRDLRSLLGPRAAVPVLAGMVAGAAVAGLLQAAGLVGVLTSGYLGLALATVVGAVASPERAAPLRPAGLAGAAVLTGLAVVQLLGSGHWSALAALLAVAAVPAVVVAARQPTDRPGALPIAVGCLAAAVLLAEADGSLGPAPAGQLLVLLCLLALGSATALRGHRAELPLTWTAAGVALLGLVHLARAGHLGGLALGLAVVGAGFVASGTVTDRAPARAGGSAALVVAAWLAAGQAGIAVPEAYTLPAAAVLWLYSGRRLVTGASWPAWGPGLVVAFAPSVWLAVTEPDLLRLVLVVLAATLTAVAGSRWAVQAPLVVGAASLAAVALGRVIAYLPLTGLLVVGAAGAVLLTAGAVYEDRRARARAALARVTDLR
ncbi:MULTISPECIES: SCO7613 C-terminal domain-containing membrane protein [unclassified Modestobacter]